MCVSMRACMFACVCVCVHAASEHGNSYSIILYETTMRCSPDYRLLLFFWNTEITDFLYRLLTFVIPLIISTSSLCSVVFSLVPW